MDWTGWSDKLTGTVTRSLLTRFLRLGPYEESCLHKPRRIRRGPGCEDFRGSRRYPGDAVGGISCCLVYNTKIGNS
ncbi:UNVERIFIED_CONTAM: hypothetical protein NCL1_05322 [Trichonephila clavipes]